MDHRVSEPVDMSDAELRFTFKPRSRQHTLDAYDASVALYGIARSASIAAHYVVNQRIIKQAPSLRGARVLIAPPAAGSFEFIVPIFLALADPGVQASLTQNVFSNFLYDIMKNVYGRLTGSKEKPETEELKSIVRSKPGDLDAIADSIEEDVVRIHRPMSNDNSVQFNIAVKGGDVNIVNFDRSTFEYAKTKIISGTSSEYFGHVTSSNSNTIQGRFYLEEEERNIGFSVDKDSKISAAQRRVLAWSLNDWVNNMMGHVRLTGYPLTSKSGLLKHVFITGVRRG